MMARRPGEKDRETRGIMTTGELDECSRIAHLAIRTQRIVGGVQSSVTQTVYCPIQEKAVAVGECEVCCRFHKIGGGPLDQAVVCEIETVVPSPDEVALAMEEAGGPPNPVTPLSRIMSREVLCVRRETPFDEVRALLVEHRVGGVPVVDGDGKPIGMVTRTDILRVDHHLHLRQRDGDKPETGVGSEITAGEVMRTGIVALHESANIGQAAAVMAYEGVHRIPVLSDSGTIVGILTSLDVLRWFGRASGYFIPAGTHQTRS